jgi:hypothetical protein
MNEGLIAKNHGPRVLYIAQSTGHAPLAREGTSSAGFSHSFTPGSGGNLFNFAHFWEFFSRSGWLQSSQLHLIRELARILDLSRFAF